MKFFPLVWSSLMRRRMRTFLTLASVVVAFVLFGLLDSVRTAFIDVGNTVVGASQMITLSKMGFGNPLPIGLDSQIARIPGVADVAAVTFFGGYYQKPDNSVGATAVGSDYFAVNDTFVLPPAQLKAFQATRDAIVVNESTARKFGWKIGDQVPLVATAVPKKDGSDGWTFNVVGFFDAAKAEKNGMDQDAFVRWAYVDDARAIGHSTVDWYQEKLADRASADRVAHAIDAISNNSDHETTTQTLNAFIASLVSQTANIGLIVAGIMAAVFFTLILLAGNTMAQAIRERIPELAVLKTIGFRNRTLVGLVLAESVLLIAIGGMLGMLLATAVIDGLRATGASMPLLGVGGSIWGEAIVLMLAIGLIVGALPAVRGMRLTIVDALAGR